MSVAKHPSLGHIVYPAKYFTASRTYDQWVRLTAADVHSLREAPGFEGQRICFFLNHPVQYVHLVGPIVGIEDIGPKYTLITLDDGSGACIDVKITRKDASKVEAGESNTEVKNLQIDSGLGRFDVVIEGRNADIGTVIKAKCTISSFRDVRQLELKRVWIVRDTNEEVMLWREMARFRRDVLSKPWVLTSHDRQMVDQMKVEDERAMKEEEKKYRNETRLRRERHAKREESRRQHEERVEQRRKASEAKLNAGALPGSDMVWHRD